ncbi:NmrA family NAD(P)-binding protein [Azorhizobium sp. AG788]|uniref:NmrA family NAD(P)-binding protein n=1 Tax=Azorhizobium sp. AG788 TaxID=2183897 RepID=UPI003138C758
MRIAVVGATGRIGAKLTRTLLNAGHQVRALSRGGPALDALVEIGAEPFTGSFDDGTGNLDHFFRNADAAFLMVKTDWNNIHGHYADVALRFFDALRHSSVKRAVSLTSMGSEVRGSTGHFQPFYQLDQILNRLEATDLVHLRAGWFMENLFAWTDAVAQYGGIGWSLDPNVKTPWVATGDIADLAFKELTGQTGRHGVVRELGEDFTMSEVTAILAREVGRPVEYRFVDRRRHEVEAEFLGRFGTQEQWLDDTQTLDALNDGRVRFHDDRPPLPTKLEAFVRDVWKPRYLAAIAAQQPDRETFFTWSAQQQPGDRPNEPLAR